jgi:hypothetical protein
VGVRRFTALVLSENRAALDMAARLGPVRMREHAAGAVELEVDLPSRGLGPVLKEALRSAARGELALWGRR